MSNIDTSPAALGALAETLCCCHSSTYAGYLALRAVAAEKEAQAVPHVVVPQGWDIQRQGDFIQVWKDGLGAYAASETDNNIASSILYNLASDLLAAAPKAPEASKQTQDERLLMRAYRAVHQSEGSPSCGGPVCPATTCPYAGEPKP